MKKSNLKKKSIDHWDIHLIIIEKFTYKENPSDKFL